MSRYPTAQYFDLNSLAIGFNKSSADDTLLSEDWFQTPDFVFSASSPILIPNSTYSNS